MFKLSDEIVQNLKNKFGDIPIDNIIQYLFMEILQKTITDGSCHIREFGKFVAFQTYSNKLNKHVIRYKFKPSTALLNKLNNDAYLFKKIPVKSKVPFTEENKQICHDKQNNKQLNSNAYVEAERLGSKKSSNTDKIVVDETNIEEILEKSENIS